MITQTYQYVSTGQATHRMVKVVAGTGAATIHEDRIKVVLDD